VSKRAWLVFGSVQIIGCILATYGTVYSESTFVRGSWLFAFLLLLPGNLPAMALNQKDDACPNCLCFLACRPCL